MENQRIPHETGNQENQDIHNTEDEYNMDDMENQRLLYVTALMDLECYNQQQNSQIPDSHKYVDVQVQSLGTNIVPYILYKGTILKQFMKDLNIEQEDFRSKKMQKHVIEKIAFVFGEIDELRDKFIKYATTYMQRDQVINKLMTFLKVMDPAETIWFEIIKRCTGEYAEHILIGPFEYNFELYKYHFIIKRNGKIELYIPDQLRYEYMQELEHVRANVIQEIADLLREFGFSFRQYQRIHGRNTILSD